MTMPNELGSEESRRRWDAYAPKWAERFGEYGDRNREAVITPALLKMIGDVSGMQVLDAGCGEGYLSRLLAKIGAKVSAFDYADEMVRIAIERTDASLGIDYWVDNAETIPNVPDSSFDLVVSNMVLVDLEKYEDAICEAFRVLRPGGRFLLTNVHPCFMTPDSGWEFDEDGNRLHWNVDHYFDEGPQEERIFLALEDVLIQYHRTLGSYVKPIIAAGFALTDIVEPTPTAEAIRDEPRWKHDLRITHFIMFDCMKPR
jgi:ubiquinone/menaquinone biosynthesis C-methylase UbiE